MSKYSNEDCKFFGARTPEKQESTNRCRRCKEQTPDMFRECTIETNELLNTSVFIDRDGNTTVRMGRPDPVERGDEPVARSSNAVRRVKRQEKPKMADETTNPTQSQPATPKVKSTAGVLNIAKTMLADGKSNETIMQALIAAYMATGKDAKQAKHNAQSCLFNAKKKLEPKAPKAAPAPVPTTETAATIPTAPVTEAPVAVVPVEKEPGPEVEVEETTTNGTPVDDGGETEVDGSYTDDDGNPLGTES